MTTPGSFVPAAFGEESTGVVTVFQLSVDALPTTTSESTSGKRVSRHAVELPGRTTRRRGPHASGPFRRYRRCTEPCWRVDASARRHACVVGADVVVVQPAGPAHARPTRAGVVRRRHCRRCKAGCSGYRRSPRHQRIAVRCANVSSLQSCGEVSQRRSSYYRNRRCTGRRRCRRWEYPEHRAPEQVSTLVQAFPSLHEAVCSCGCTRGAGLLRRRCRHCCRCTRRGGADRRHMTHSP